VLGISKECLESFGGGPHFDDLEQFLSAFLKGLRGTSLRFPFLQLDDPALVLLFCLAFAFLNRTCYVNGRLCQLSDPSMTSSPTTQAITPGKVAQDVAAKTDILN
jgi:hypothetical protein